MFLYLVFLAYYQISLICMTREDETLYYIYGSGTLLLVISSGFSALLLFYFTMLLELDWLLVSAAAIALVHSLVLLWTAKVRVADARIDFNKKSN